MKHHYSIWTPVSATWAKTTKPGCWKPAWSGSASPPQATPQQPGSAGSSAQQFSSLFGEDCFLKPPTIICSSFSLQTKNDLRTAPKEGFLHATASRDLQHMVIDNETLFFPSYSTQFWLCLSSLLKQNFPWKKVMKKESCNEKVLHAQSSTSLLSYEHHRTACTYLSHQRTHGAQIKAARNLAAFVFAGWPLPGFSCVLTTITTQKQKPEIPSFVWLESQRYEKTQICTDKVETELAT